MEIGTSGVVFPNEAVEWSILIALYPYITGLVAGSFIISALVYVFNNQRLKSVAKLSFLTSLAFLLLSFLPLMGHLRQPQRAFEIITGPNFSSAMAAFGYIYFFYLIIAIVEAFFLFRAGWIGRINGSGGLSKALYTILSLGTKDVSEKAVSRDAKIVKALATIGVPTAVLFHGYVGFIFGAAKANPLWSTPLMPVMFLLSAIVSGIALVILVYSIISYLSRSKPLTSVISGMALLLGWFLIIDISFHASEELYRAYERTASWEVVEAALYSQLYWTHIWGEFIIGAAIPLVAIAIPAVRRSGGLMTVVSLLVLTGIFSMRWNVVIGAQLISRSGKGFLTYVPPLLGRESIFSAIGLLAAGIFLMILFTSLMPWREQEKGVVHVG